MSARPRIGFINEDVHGHSSVDLRLRQLLRGRDDITPCFARVPAPNRVEALMVRPVPRLGDLDLQPLRWRLRYSWRTRRIAALLPECDAIFVESQACALLAGAPMRRAPWVLSADATARQFAALEYWRPRDRFSPLGQSAIEVLERRAYRRAHKVVAWSHWTAGSLRRDFGVPEERIEVLHPGVPIPDAAPGPRDDGPRRMVRALFVGNDVRRKGLDVALAALQKSRATAQLDVVTGDPVPRADGLTVHRDVNPDSAELRYRYSEADLLLAPTLGDCVPLAIVEAMAAGLPVISTNVGAVPELVADAGLIVPPGDAVALAAAFDELASDPGRRAELGARAFARAREHYDVRRQTDRLVDVMRMATAARDPRR